ncbi:MAG: tetratricopeptide repeat protein [Massiliimalia sp.]|jgi:tetratricopeptide (TPR) repeat protein
MTVIFCKIGWMTYYSGSCQADPYQGVNPQVAYNFQDYNGFCYGAMEEIPQLSEEQKEDVTVIWIANDEYQTQPVIVGWYQHAVLYRDEQVQHDKYSIGRELRYYAKAKSSDCVLLPLSERNLVIRDDAKQDPMFLGMLLDYLDHCKIEPINLRYTEDVLSRVLADPGLNYDELMEAGDDAVDQEEYYKALLYFNTAFHQKKNIDAIFNIGSMLESLFCFDEAIKIFEKLRQLEGDEPDTLDNLLNLYLQTGQYEKALEISHLAIESAEDQEEICGILCTQTDIFHQLGQLDKAIACLDFILEHSEDDVMRQEAHACKHQLLAPAGHGCMCEEDSHEHCHCCEDHP